MSRRYMGCLRSGRGRGSNTALFMILKVRLVDGT